MRMIRGVFILLAILMTGSILISCGHSEDPAPPVNEKRDMTVLLYAVASNDLESYLESDKSEILRGASSMNLDGLCMLVYQVTSKGNPVLLELKKDETGKPVFKEIKEYDRSLYSTDPERISQVIADVKELKDADKYGLVLWSHGTGIDPSEATHGQVAPTETQKMDLLECFSFGADKDSSKNPNYTDTINIDELSDAIPDNVFEFIWFDACYMSGIETVYQLRKKCNYFVGYPTEVFSPGMPYDLTLPFFLSKTPDLVGGAKAFFNYYNLSTDSQLRVATVAVLDMAAIEEVADACSRIYKGVTSVPSSEGLICYTRRKVGPFYDFGQFTEKMAELNPENPSLEKFNNAMRRFVVWCDASETDFNYRPIDHDHYSGVSCFIYDPTSSSDKNGYYHSLDWYKAVYSQN